MNEQKDQPTPISVNIQSGDGVPSGPVRSGKKGLALGVVLLLLIVIGGLWAYQAIFKNKLNSAAVPSANPYPAGTSIQNPPVIPADFPLAALREQYKPDQVDSVTFPDGKNVITVGYNSENSLFGLLSTYTSYFKTAPWKLQSSELLQNSGVIVAKNEVGTMTVTIAPAKDNKGSRVTFSYQYTIK